MLMCDAVESLTVQARTERVMMSIVERRKLQNLMKNKSDYCH